MKVLVAVACVLLFAAQVHALHPLIRNKAFRFKLKSQSKAGEGWEYCGGCEDQNADDCQCDKGPAKWGDVPGMSKCGEGKSQSPVDIAGAKFDGSLSPLDFTQYKDEKGAKFFNNGHAVGVTLPAQVSARSRLAVGPKLYQLKDFEFHTPSEHHINGQAYGLEMQLRHINGDGKYAIVSVLFEKGTADDTNIFLNNLDPTSLNMLAQDSGETDVGRDVNLVVGGHGIPLNHEFYHYEGSQTAPPCEEGVQWYIIKKVQKISPAQLAEFQEIYGGNNRPLQELNDRVIDTNLEDSMPCPGENCGGSSEEEVSGDADGDGANDDEGEDILFEKSATVAPDDEDAKDEESEGDAPSEGAAPEGEEAGEDAEAPAAEDSGEEEAEGGDGDEQAQGEGNGGKGAWGYSGDTAPEKWASLSEDYALCANTQDSAQSPIDIKTEDVNFDMTQEALSFMYDKPRVTEVNNGHTIQVNYPEASGSHLPFAALGTYKLKQFHFHSPSEHKIDGKSFPLEMQVVHMKESDPSAIAIVSVLFEEGDQNEFLNCLGWDSLPSTDYVNGLEIPEDKVDLANMFPTDHTYFHYEGSITTPPCSEGVQWFVLRNPLSISAAQVGKFQAMYKGTNRPVQALNSRDVKTNYDASANQQDEDKEDAEPEDDGSLTMFDDEDQDEDKEVEEEKKEESVDGDGNDGDGADGDAEKESTDEELLCTGHITDEIKEVHEVFGEAPAA